jgi:probable F420-dependent oxidoreductase
MPVDKPLFSFGIYPYDRLLDVDDLARVVQAGESAGFDVVGFPDHLLPPPESHEALFNQTWWDLPALCSFLAAKTSTIQFYLSVLVLPYHPPIQLAKALATLDHVSKGRTIVGVGAGWYEEEFIRLGVSFAQRGEMTDEYVRAIIELWTADRPSFEGKFVSFHDVSFYPKPFRKPHPPIVVGGTGPRPFRRAAAVGDGWVPMQGSHQQIAEQFKVIRVLASEAGRDPSTIWCGAGITMSSGSEAERAAEHIRGRAAAVVPKGVEEAVHEVRQLGDMGIDLISVSFRWDDPAAFVDQLSSFGEKVISRFR